MTDTTLLTWINAEVERALNLVQESIARFSAAPDDVAVLQPCPEHLHQVSGALRMVGLAGATAVCEAIEGSFAASLNGTRPSVASMQVIDRAVVALKTFVSELARGHADVPLRLFPVYRDLAGLLGKATTSEKELFFPDLTLNAPPHASPKALPEEELPAFLQAQRTRFQRGLLAWLRGGPAGLEEMRQTVDALHQIATQLPEPKALWFAAGALMDALEHERNPGPEWLNAAKVVCNRLDFQIRDLAAGGAKNGEALLREVLYAVARQAPATARIKQVKGLYQLENLFPRVEAPVIGLELDAERLEAALFDMHSRLESIKRTWEQYVGGERDKARAFRERIADFKAKTRDLGNQHLIKLLDAISLAAAKLPDPYPRDEQMMVIEMASAFLLVEHIIDHFSSPADDLDAQIVIMGGWLLDAASRKSNGEPPAGLRPDLTERIGALQLRAQVAKEILANLQHVEQVIDAFARDKSRRPTLVDLQPYLRQMHGALTVLGFPGAAQAIAVCEKLLVEPDDEIDWIAEALSSVGFFLEPCRHGRNPQEEAIALFFRRYEKRHEPAPAAAPAPAQPAVNNDDELMGVFLEEAQEVLETIRTTLPACREKPDDREALTTVRRAFHTIKGSGRMVGLTEVGEAAWEVEQAMNLFLEEKRPASDELFALLDAALAAFAQWLQDRKADFTGLPALARRAKAQASNEITIGTVTLTRGLYDIYTKEASEHIRVLRDESARWREAPGDVSADFMRAAHTLGSTSRTAGFIPLADLAASLEHWSGFARETSAEDAETIQAAVVDLGIMVEAISKGDAPAINKMPQDALHELISRLESARLAKPPVIPAQAGTAVTASTRGAARRPREAEDAR